MKGILLWQKVLGLLRTYVLYVIFLPRSFSGVWAAWNVDVYSFRENQRLHLQNDTLNASRYLSPSLRWDYHNFMYQEVNTSWIKPLEPLHLKHILILNTMSVEKFKCFVAFFLKYFMPIGSVTLPKFIVWQDFEGPLKSKLLWIAPQLLLLYSLSFYPFKSRFSSFWGT